MFKDIGLGEWLLEMDETPVEKILEPLSAIDAGYPAAQAKVKNAMAYVHDCFAGPLKRVKSIHAALRGRCGWLGGSWYVWVG